LLHNPGTARYLQNSQAIKAATMKKVMPIFLIPVVLFVIAMKPESTIEKESPSTQKEKNIALARRFYEEVVNQHNVDKIDSFASSEYVEHQYDTHFDGDLKGIKKAFKHYFSAFPDMHVKVNFMMAENDLVTVQITTTGTNTGSIYGRPATNKKFEINGVDIIRFKHGKVVEHWGYAEEGKLLTQLGLIRSMMREKDKEEVIVK
jgi:steroid delta-isomerase-like uncharacterized protein